MVKIADVAPMPSAIVAIAVAVKVGLRRSDRIAWRKSGIVDL
jgi:hypothetical protein